LSWAIANKKLIVLNGEVQVAGSRQSLDIDLEEYREPSCLMAGELRFDHRRIEGHIPPAPCQRELSALKKTVGPVVGSLGEFPCPGCHDALLSSSVTEDDNTKQGRTSIEDKFQLN
jgi:hypothetical protein